MRHLDLFTGIGGFHLAAGWAGFQTIGFSEVEPYCCQLLAEKWPEISNYGDIRTADFSGFRGRITVLSAGVPCQPASLAGKRRGAGDDRWLWPAVLDVVGTVQPAWCLLENPPGILTMDEFGGVLLRLESLGYQVRAFSVPANAVGAKHRRQRVFIVANRNSNECERQRESRILGSTAREAQSESGCGLDKIWWDETTVGDSGQALANTERERCNGRRAGWAEAVGSGSRDAVIGSSTNSEALADTDRAGLEEHESRQPGQFSAVIRSSGINGAGELESRIRRSFNGVCDWPYPLTTERIPDRSYRLKALGNAVVPQQAYPFFAAIAQVERRL